MTWQKRNIKTIDGHMLPSFPITVKIQSCAYNELFHKHSNSGLQKILKRALPMIVICRKVVIILYEACISIP